jgi:voltage-gated potassium channel Kch
LIVQLCVALLISALIGYATWAKVKAAHAAHDGSGRDVFLAGGGLSWLYVAGSITLTNLSTEQLVGNNGNQMLLLAWWELAGFVGLLILAGVFVPVYYRNGCTTVTELLLDNGIDPTVIELNLETARRLLAFGVRAIYGDASRTEVLERAGIARADHLILTSGAGAVDEEIIRRAKAINPHVRVLARTHYTHELPRLRRAGADDVFSGEGEVALAFTARILEHLGASPDQIDRERSRGEATFRDG